MFRNNDVSDGGLAVLLVPPEAPVITLEECKAALGISGTEKDSAITAAIGAVTGTLDPAFGGFLGRGIGTQKWQLQLRSFSDRRPKPQAYANPLAIPLPYPPLISVDGVKYIDGDGNDVALLLGTDFRVLGMGAPLSKQSIAPLYAKAWPVARADDASVRIEFTCGYDGETNKMPPNLLQAICLGVRALLSAGARDVLLTEDRVEGIGSQRYQATAEATEIVTRAVSSLLANLVTS
jgi:hypothetical protein